jgi:hypothetical protein
MASLHVPSCRNKKNMSSADYINQLFFDYIETYSFQRGEGGDENYRLLYKEYQALYKKRRLISNEGGRLSKEEAKRLSETGAIAGDESFQTLIDKEGKFHHSSIKTNTFSHNHPKIQVLREILQRPVVSTNDWLCAPVYRDAVIFYNANKNIVSVFNICLGCEYMYDTLCHDIQADATTYDLLSQFFTDIGHNVEKYNNITSE